MNTESQLLTKRLILRRYDLEADCAAAFELYSRWEVVQFLGANPAVMESLDQMRARIESNLKMEHSRADGTGRWVIVPRDGDGQMVGVVLFAELPDGAGNLTGDFEIGWHLHPKVWGMGLATEAAIAVRDFAFGVMPGLLELRAIAYPQNVKSLRVMERIGMELEGKTDRYYGIETVCYRISRESWEYLRG